LLRDFLFDTRCVKALLKLRHAMEVSVKDARRIRKLYQSEIERLVYGHAAALPVHLLLGEDEPAI
jgi:hypothetical protein